MTLELLDPALSKTCLARRTTPRGVLCHGLNGCGSGSRFPCISRSRDAAALDGGSSSMLLVWMFGRLKRDY
jgi:hypothetical protein